jgi:hypothetical protein
MDEVKSLEHLLKIQSVLDIVKDKMEFNVTEVDGRLYGQATIKFGVRYRIPQEDLNDFAAEMKAEAHRRLLDDIYGPLHRALRWYAYEVRQLAGNSSNTRERFAYIERLMATLDPFDIDGSPPDDRVVALEKEVESLKVLVETHEARQHVLLHQLCLAKIRNKVVDDFESEE